MEKPWEEFWTTGKVSDYLAYCSYRDENGSKLQGKRTEEQLVNGTVRDSDRHSADLYADRGL